MLIGRVPFVTHRLAYYWLLLQENTIVEEEKIDKDTLIDFSFTVGCERIWPLESSLQQQAVPQQCGWSTLNQ